MISVTCRRPFSELGDQQLLDQTKRLAANQRCLEVHIQPCRLIRNRFTESWEGRQDQIEPYPLQALHVGHAASELGRYRGDTDNGVLPAGQSSGLIHQVIPAGQVVHDVMTEAAAALERLGA